MTDIIPDPDFDGFDGIYVGTKDGYSPPPNNINYDTLGAYLRQTGKTFTDLSQEEVDRFKFKPAQK
ncbi:MAG: hypothetical protein IKG82_11515 [Oscillospiraceae bacterium]|nr:hypothetical protein [Oscillospiraceae bacterium]